MILENTNIWLTQKGIQLNPFTTISEDDIVGPIGNRSKPRTKNRKDLVASPKAPKYKLTIGTSRGKEQEKYSTKVINKRKNKNQKKGSVRKSPLMWTNLKKKNNSMRIKKKKNLMKKVYLKFLEALNLKT